ncbi:MAG: hypothetical protein ACI81G_001360, partial [Gammaproteobacteria bacterium]
SLKNVFLIILMTVLITSRSLSKMKAKRRY